MGNRRLHKELIKLCATGASSPLGAGAVPYGLGLATELGVLQAMFPSVFRDPEVGRASRSWRLCAAGHVPFSIQGPRGGHDFPVVACAVAESQQRHWLS